MRKITLIQLFILIFFIWIVLSINLILPKDYIGALFLVILFVFILIINLDYFSEQPLGYAKWVNPILDLMVALVKLDCSTGLLESKRVKKYLDNEFDPFTSRLKYAYFKTKLKEKIDVPSKLSYLKDNTSSMERMRVINELVKIALVDRLMSDREMEFITKVSKRLGIHSKTLNSILQIHNYITEDEIKNQKASRPSINRNLQKAYSILGLEIKASEKQIKTAYRELVKLYHPDKQRGSKKKKLLAKAQFQIIAEAYELIKKERRF